MSHPVFSSGPSLLKCGGPALARRLSACAYECSILTLSLLVLSCGRVPIDPRVSDRAAPSAGDWVTATALTRTTGILDRATMAPLALQARAGEVPIRFYVDEWPAWSPDGRWITFHRTLPSSYGPPGLYIVSRYGGTPRLLLSGNYLFPREVSFSPDGRRLVCNDGNQLTFVDLGTGAVTRPMFTDNGAAYPDWSPDGRSVAYGRIFLRGFPPEPPDSAGLHVFDVISGVDRPLRHGADVLPSAIPQWVRNGSALALIYGDYDNFYLGLATVDGREFNPLLSVPFPKRLWNLQHLEPARPRAGPLATESLVLQVVWRELEHTYRITVDPVAISERRPLGPLDFLSPDGREVVVISGAPDSLGVLFVGHADAPPQAKRMQLTHYAPP